VIRKISYVGSRDPQGPSHVDCVLSWVKGEIGHFQLRGVDEAKEIFGLRVSQTVALQREEA
jgi:hypothetical protein